MQIKNLVLVIFYTFVLLMSVPMSWAQTNQKPKPKLIELTVGFNSHRFRSDKDGRFQFGTPPVELGIDGSVGLRQGRKLFGGDTVGGYNQSVGTSNLPNAVIAAANTRGIPLQETSLRLQNAWVLKLGAYPINDLQVGYRFSKDSWRYDLLSRPFGATIPYIKGAQTSHGLFARYTKDIRRLVLLLEGGAGNASIRFLNGEERFLSDNDDNVISSPSGVTIPLSVGVGYRVDSSGHFLLPFLRYDYVITRAGGTHITNKRFFFGLQVSW